MSEETPVNDEASIDVAVTENDVAEDSSEETSAPRLSLEVDITDVGPCRKHLRVTIPRSDLDSFYDVETEELVGTAAVPGFRVGHVPRKLIQKRFRKELADQVRQKLLVSSLEQIAEEHELNPINEPDLDIEAIEIPDEGDFEYEFDIEVRPEFGLPEYKGLQIERPTGDVTDDDVEQRLGQFLEQYGQLEVRDGAAESGDTLSLSVEFQHNGELLSKINEFDVKLAPSLQFQDAEINEFDKLMSGVKAGDKRDAELTISGEVETLEMRGETVSAQLTVLAVKQLAMPEMDSEFYTRVGVSDDTELRTEIRAVLERQVTYQQRQAVRKQVLEKITESADWDLPEDMVMKQVENALRREILEMQQAGYRADEIRARENELRQKAVTSTRQALKEHFVLDRIAEDQDIEVQPFEIDMELQLMAMQSGESLRRIRARLRRSGMDENLEAQIRERKSVDFILEHAQFTDVPLDLPQEGTVSAVSYAVCGTETAGATEEDAAEGDADE